MSADKVTAVNDAGGQQVIEHITENLPDGIVERFLTSLGDGPKQVVTSFAPSATPHTEYPSVLPFVPHTPVYVTLYTGNELPPGARWQTSSPDAIAEFLIAQSRADGWYDAPPEDARVRVIRAIKQPVPTTSTYLLKSGTLRTILIAAVGADSLVQLLDQPTRS